MRKIQNFKIAPNFWFYELMEGTLMPAIGHQLNWEYLLECNVQAQQSLYFDIQEIRNWVNYKFRPENNGIEIGIEITSGFRCLQYELYKGRSGLSRHIIDGTDGRPMNVSSKLSTKIIYAVEEEYGHKWQGGFAIAEPDPKKGLTGFFHFDKRKGKVRWIY